MNEEIVGKPRNVLINPDAFHEALRARKSLGQWLEQAIEERIEREEKNLKQKRPAAAGLSRVIR